MFEDLNFNLGLGSDNHSGVHPRVMEAIVACNRGHAHAYGGDEVSELARREFARVFGPEARVEYVFNGTAANVLCLAPGLRRFEAVICAEVAHLQMDEGGAPEKFLGAKLWTVPSTDGKFSPKDAAFLLERRGDQHYAQAAAVSVTLPSEMGVSYSLNELKSWRKFADDKSLMLHIDGARLANAAAFLRADLRAIVEAARPDAISFGGTKNGLLGAEAVVLLNPRWFEEFRFHRKQAMQLASKTRYMAAQFYAYLKDDLWLEIARHVVDQAQSLARRLEAEVPEIRLAFPVESNALFVKIPPEWLKAIRQRYFFYIWDRPRSLGRWMISWDWTADQSDDLIAFLKTLRLKPKRL